MSRRQGKLSTTRTATSVMTSAARTRTRRKRIGSSTFGGGGDSYISCGGADVVDASSTGLTGTGTSATHHPRRSGRRVRPRVRILCETSVVAAATSALVMMLMVVPSPPANDEGGEEESAGTVMRLMMTMDAAVTTILWSTSQLLRSTLPFLFASGSDFGANGTTAIGPFERNVGRMEEAAWIRWERRAKLRSEDPDDGGRCGVGTVAKVTTLPIPVLDFACPDRGTRIVLGPGGVASDGHHYCIDWEEEYAKFRSAEVAGAEYDLWKNIGLTLDGPILLRNLWNATATIATDSTEAGSTGADIDTCGCCGTFHPLTLLDLSRPPLGDLPVQLYSDSSRSGPDALRPDAISPLRSVVNNVTSDGDSTQKIGTQIPVLSKPELIYRVAPRDVVRCLFGDRFRPEHVETKLGGLLPAWTTVPIFLARGRDSSRTVPTAGTGGDGGGGGAKAKEVNVRTDLHCEPIGNVAVQLHGERRWTLISPRHSYRLRPTVSRHGRAFFHSTLDPASLLFDDDGSMSSNVPRYEVVTREGDAVWVPPWTWHRIDYVPGVVSFGASLFHFRPWEFVRNNPLFAALVVPNLVKELVQMKTE